nr:PREDICTED: Krueppel-like factor luna [Bemisia tabaci]
MTSQRSYTFPRVKDRADRKCDEAFKFLDEEGRNNCREWESAECRLVPVTSPQSSTQTKSYQCTVFHLPMNASGSIGQPRMSTLDECEAQIASKKSQKRPWGWASTLNFGTTTKSSAESSFNPGATYAPTADTSAGRGWSDFRCLTSFPPHGRAPPPTAATSSSFSTDVTKIARFGLLPSSTNTDVTQIARFGVNPSSTNTDVTQIARFGLLPSSTNTDVTQIARFGLLPSSTNTDVTQIARFGVNPSSTNTDVTQIARFGVNPSSTNTDVTQIARFGLLPSSTNTDITQPQRLGSTIASGSGTQQAGRFGCPLCPEGHSTIRDLMQHMLDAHPGNTICVSCNKDFKEKAKLIDHLGRKKHSLLELDTTTYKKAKPNHEKRWRCNYEGCDAAFGRENTLKDHMAVHDGRATCPHCNRVLYRKSNLPSHIRTEHPEEYKKNPPKKPKSKNQ